MFKVSDVIQHEVGGVKLRIHLIEEFEYKTTRLDNAECVLIKIDDPHYQLVHPPEDEAFYQIGQVLTKKEGGPEVAIVIKITPGVQSDFNLYDLILIHATNGYRDKMQQVDEKRIKAQYSIQDLKWMIMYGSPIKIARDFLSKKIEMFEDSVKDLKKVIGFHEDLQRRLHLFEIKSNDVE
jgi:hypothetical protein